MRLMQSGTSKFTGFWMSAAAPDKKCCRFLKKQMLFAWELMLLMKLRAGDERSIFR